MKTILTIGSIIFTLFFVIGFWVMIYNMTIPGLFLQIVVGLTAHGAFFGNLYHIYLNGWK